MENVRPLFIQSIASRAASIYTLRKPACRYNVNPYIVLVILGLLETVHRAEFTTRLALKVQQISNHALFDHSSGLTIVRRYIHTLCPIRLHTHNILYVSIYLYIYISISISLYIHKVVVGSTSNTSMMCVALDNNIDLSMTYFASSGP